METKVVKIIRGLASDLMAMGRESVSSDVHFLGSCSSPNVVKLPQEEKFILPSLASGKPWAVDNLYPGDEQSKKVPGRRRSSLKVLMQPTESVDRGWSWVVCIACFFTTDWSDRIFWSIVCWIAGVLQRF